MEPNETIRTILQRRSVRSFTQEPVSQEDLQLLVEAGDRAPYAEEHSRHFTVLGVQEMIDALNETAKRTAAGMNIPHLAALGADTAFHCLYRAPAVILVSGREATVGYEQDCAAATQNILLAATSLQLGSCWVFFATLAFLDPEQRELLDGLRIPRGYKPMTAIALGHTDMPVRPRERAELQNCTWLL